MNFEGPEKKLEVILLSPSPDIRDNADNRWERVTEASGCRIISRIGNDCMDAYLLSESSLFVWNNGFVIITCGKTSLINALDEMLKIIPQDKIAFMFYERKNLIFPNEQPSNFEDDAAHLLKYFPGKSYRMGPANDDHLHVFYYARPEAVTESDSTLQILMNDLDSSVTSEFQINGAKSSETAEMEKSLHSIFRRPMTIDDYRFAPYGYSLNGITGENYYTIHVTPQSGSSYTSFETNILETDYARIIQSVVSLFKPGKFTIVLTTSMDAHFLSLHKTVEGVLTGYHVTERSLYEFDCGYKVTYLNYVRR